MVKSDSNPKVSILLPNLNNRPYLEERIHTILDQTLTDWELIVVDSYSDDGAWELFQTFANQDQRIKLFQMPREGIYAGLNRCIELATGEYIYIATSDDTMMSSCLETMVREMDTHPQCGICHTLLKIIDEKGEEIPCKWDKMPPNQFYGSLMQKKHIRQSPYDGILYCALGTIYISLTQLLIRRTVFDKIGLFRSNWGSISDFEWGMRAALVCDTLHLPVTLATWRIHRQQATDLSAYASSEHQSKLLAMVKAALPILQTHNPRFYQQLDLDRLFFIYRRQQLRLGLKECSSKKQEFLYSLSFLKKDSSFVRRFLYRKLFLPVDANDNFTYIQEELNRLGLTSSIILLE